MDNYEYCFNTSLVHAYPHDYTCDFSKVSCRYLSLLEESTAKKVYYKTIDEAYEASKRLDVIGFIHFTKNFTESMAQISMEGRDANDGSFENSEIQIRLDMSDQTIGYFMERRLLETYLNFAKSLMSDCHYPENLAQIPIKFEEPIFGHKDEEYTTFVAPGVIMT